MSSFMLLASRLPEQREQSSRHHSRNGLRFFAGYAAKKWPSFGAAEVTRQGNQKRLRPLQKTCLGPKYA